MDQTPPSNPLETLWRIVSVPLSIIGLASLSDVLVQWDDFILQLIESYRFVVHGFFNFLLGWLPFRVPTWVYDYITVGMIFATSFAKGFRAVDVSTPDPVAALIRFIGWGCGWPIALLFLVSSTCRSWNDYSGEEFDTMDIVIWQWLGAILLGFTLLLTVNYTFLLR